MRTPSAPETEHHSSRPMPQHVPRRRPHALAGVQLGLKGQSGFAVHLFTTALIFAGGLTLGFSVIEWGLFTVALGILFAAELFHAAISKIVQQELTPTADSIAELSAGAVLMCRVTVAVLALLIFGSRLWNDFLPKLMG